MAARKILPDVPTHQETELFRASKEGAASALAWIAKRESNAREAVERYERELIKLQDEQSNPPASKDGFDYKPAIDMASRNLRDATDRHFQLLKTLREYDKQVDVSKRDVSESMSRDEVIKVSQMMVIYIRTSGEDLIGLLSQSILEQCRTSEDVYKLFGTRFRECVMNSLKGAVQEGHVASWVAKAVEEVL